MLRELSNQIDNHFYKYHPFRIRVHTANLFSAFSFLLSISVHCGGLILHMQHYRDDLMEKLGLDHKPNYN